MFLVEGDSAKSFFPMVRNKMKHGMYQLRGKVKNVYGKSILKILENNEYKDIVNIVNLKYGETLNNLYFDKIGILTDADVDGDHISSMLILFFYTFFPKLFEQKRILKILSPIVIAKKGKQVKKFYTYEEFLEKQDKYEGWALKYNKGLGGLNKQEYSEMINDLKYEEIENIDKEENKAIIDMLFGNDTNKRKNWLQGMLKIS